MHVPRISLSRIWSLAVPSLFIGGLAWTLAGCHEDHAPGGGRKDDSWLPGEACLRGAKEPGCTELDEEILLDSRDPTQIVGSGTPESCTSEVVVSAIAEGGIIHFDCGSEPHTIVLKETAKIMNDSTEEIVIDGGGLITLSGGGERRILYMNTCDPALVWTTPHCDNQDHPRLTLQNLRFVDGDSTGSLEEGGGGGAVFVRGGRLKIVNSVFERNRCEELGPDLGGGALRVLSQHEGRPVYIAGSRFGAEGDAGNRCSNGGAISSIGVSFIITRSEFLSNRAIGYGANPARQGTPGGGSGGALYLDGNDFSLSLSRVRIEANHAREGGGAIFFVSNDRSGSLRIEHSELIDNRSEGFETSGYPGIFILADGDPEIVESVLR